MTAIEWCHRPGTVARTWNPTKGCSRISEGCRRCYAEQQAARIVRMGKGKPTPYDSLVKVVNGEARWTGVVRLVPETLAQPLGWKQPSTVFVDSMSDLFHESLTNEQIAAVYGVMAACPQHTFIVLTKRARRRREWFQWLRKAITGHWHGQHGVLFENLASVIGDEASNSAWQRVVAHEPTPANLGDAGCHEWPLPHVWEGVSVENQDAADERIPELLATPAALRFLSCEPLLGPLDLTDRLGVWTSCPECGRNVSIDEDQVRALPKRGRRHGDSAMITVKYRCRTHGEFKREFDIGGRGRLERAPVEHPCPVCESTSPRKHAFHVSVSAVTYKRMKEYCAKAGTSMAALLKKATGVSDE